MFTKFQNEVVPSSTTQCAAAAGEVPPADEETDPEEMEDLPRLSRDWTVAGATGDGAASEDGKSEDASVLFLDTSGSAEESG